MTILNGYTNAAPHHRQNRRRERPGSRTRRTISRKSVIQSTINEGILEARDSSVPLPSDKAKPSPLLRQNFDQSWQRWKTRQAQEAAAASFQQLQLEQERMLLFGGEVDDDISITRILDTLPSSPIFSSLSLQWRWRYDRYGRTACLRILLRQELFRLGILYFGEGERQGCDSHVLCDVPVRQEAPMFVMRPSRRLRRRRSTLRSGALPLYLSFSDLSDDVDIARLLSSEYPHNTPTIQHRKHIPSTQASIIEFDIPLSLPPSTTPALSSTGSNFFDNTLPTSPTLVQQEGEDWTFITTTHTRNDTPSTEPETWSLCDDS